MSEAQLFEILTEMRLSGAREELEHQLANTGYADMPFVDRMLRMFQAEADRRQRNRIERLTQAAQFKYVNANPEAIDYSKDRKLDKAHVLDLVKCEWISRGQNMVITGASGTGKTWLACALGNSAVRHEKSTRYVRTSRLAEELNFARLDGSLTKLRTKIARLDLLILDDFALLPMAQQEKADLFEVIEDRDERASTMLISQRPIADWYEFVGEDLLADAFLDRVRNRTHRIQLEGKSKRG